MVHFLLASLAISKSCHVLALLYQFIAPEDHSCAETGTVDLLSRFRRSVNLAFIHYKFLGCCGKRAPE